MVVKDGHTRIHTKAHMIPHQKFNSEFFKSSFRCISENLMKIIIFIPIVIANATCPSKCGWKIFDGDDKIASVDALTFAGTDEQKELMDVFDQDTYTRFNLS